MVRRNIVELFVELFKHCLRVLREIVNHFLRVLREIVNHFLRVLREIVNLRVDLCELFVRCAETLLQKSHSGWQVVDRRHQEALSGCTAAATFHDK